MFQYQVLIEHSLLSIQSAIKTSVCDIVDKCSECGIIAKSVHQSVLRGNETPEERVWKLLIAVGDQIKTDEPLARINRLPMNLILWSFWQFLGRIQCTKTWEEIWGMLVFPLLKFNFQRTLALKMSWPELCIWIRHWKSTFLKLQTKTQPCGQSLFLYNNNNLMT